MLNILLTGANGLLGQEFRERLENNPQYRVYCVGHQECDITDIRQIENYITGKKINFIINCAADRNAELMEENEAKAKLITVDGPKNLAVIAKKIKACLIHFSSDYVFDGTKTTPYKETDTTNGLSVYGKLKIEGENEVLKNANTCLIIRTAWLFSKYGKDFVKTIRYLAGGGKAIRVVFDQVGSPCYAGDLTQYILQILPLIKSGTKEIYHLTNEGVCSWYDLAHQIVKEFNLDCRVIPIHTNEFSQKAKRPAYSVLDKTKIKNDFGLQIRHYSEGLKECIQKIKGETI